MRNFKFLILVFALSLPFLSLGQNSDDNLRKLKSNKKLYESFSKFIKDAVQETKNKKGKPYYYKIEQINGVHNFDYNEDGLEDALVEFSTDSFDGKGNYLLVAVLFKNAGNGYGYATHMNPDNTFFEKYAKSIFYFSGRLISFSDEVVTEKYTLIVNKFVRK